MRLITFKVAGGARLGAQIDGTVVDLQAADGGTDGLFADMLSFIRSGAAGRARAEAAIASGKARLPAADAPLLAPLRPSTILCAGSNYHAHNAEKKDSPTSGKEPEFFVKTADCVVGPDEPILFDERLTRKLDCETELAVVMGTPGRHIPVARALDHVFGYTIVNDVTARDRQVRTNEQGFTWYELGRGKAFDTSAPLGPCIVTADEIGDPQKLDLKTRINGDLRQSSNTADMIWSCAELIHFFSINFTLQPGMVIITGTPAGTAWSTDTELGGKWRNLPGLVPATRYCLPGDVVECDLEKIGTLRNPVAGA
ncbi:fumarylacetoacetate hydrolase family protein [Aquabacter spiritensis]|uniref:2-keto-4-pentenoate hydratase/2-oxohepta-3-ene-1,7-dioic acid hydratase in catechol pathway n=1 Tax=Aquabacter spiritensis TaxID=933073 RepID=A0A4R3LY54_9HYPH|nr:fumarylacetoacetate hydrolase family protein [Aquabacter spiritensis]TCT05582.1 2-keto-4-pentenoate hydratase/2-oxohepta-3-ene-1,7-dioic acid hydratase in catechol pathway [Aquabacter spiritensis]